MEAEEDKNFKSPIYPFYYNRKDKRIMVPRLLGVGWTLNFGHPVMWLIILILIAIPLIQLFWH
jgi:uncharacterized membrane protein